MNIMGNITRQFVESLADKPFLTFSSVQSFSRVRIFVTSWTAARQASLSITNCPSSVKLMPTELVMPSNYVILCRPFSSHLQSFSASGSFPMSQCFTSVQFSSVAQLCPTLPDPMDNSRPGLPVHHQLPDSTQLISIELVMPPFHLILCCPLLLQTSIFPNIRVFSNESAFCMRWPKYWSFSFSIRPSNEHPGLISFRMDWLDLLAVQGTLESSPAPQFKSINSSSLSFHYSPTITSIHDHRRNHSLD